jgi:hypothetical protein
MNWQDAIQQNMMLNTQRALAEAKAAGDETWIAQIEASTPGLLEFVGAFNRKGGIGLVETVGPPKIIRG